MTYRGHIKNGQIKLDKPVELPEGALVSVAVLETPSAGSDVWQKLRALAGTLEGPPDWSRNHDHYIHGTPRKP